MVWPSGLAAFYPTGRVAPWWQAGGAALLLALGTVTALGQRRRRPFVPVGWFWFLGTLVPVIGLVQVGSQSLADRYTYVPLIGLFLIVAWGSAELAGRMRPGGVPVSLPAASACGVLLVLAVLSWRQAALWKSSAALFSHAVAVTENNWLAHANLASALALQGRTDEAVAHYEAALRRDSASAPARNNLGLALARSGRTREAVAVYRDLLAASPDYVEAHYNLGAVLAGEGRLEEAIVEFSTALRLRPDLAAARRALA